MAIEPTYTEIIEYCVKYGVSEDTAKNELKRKAPKTSKPQKKAEEVKEEE